MPRLLWVAGLLAWQLAVAAPAHANPGDLDPTFGTGGKVTTDFFRHFDQAAALAVQADGKLVAAGGVARPAAGGRTTGDFGLARYSSDSTLDRRFGTGGKVTTDFAANHDVATALVVQPDGKLVAAGFTLSQFGSASDFVLARYNPNGSLDASFGTGGKVTTSFGRFAQAYGLVVQADGKLVAAGSVGGGVGADFALARYNPDGSLDASFGVGGKVTTDFAPAGGQATALVIQGDGRLVAAGFTTSEFGSDFALARYNPDGSLDASFGTGGIVTTDFSGIDEAHALALQADGKLVAAGSAVIGPSFDFALARYNPDGTLDASFGTGGKVTTDFFGDSDQALALGLQADGKLVAAGAATSGPTQEDTDFALARYLAG